MIRTAILLLILAAPVSAGPFGLFSRRGGSGGSTTTGGGQGLWTAQQAAEYQASLCRMGHFGNPSGGFEGVARAMSAAAALANTCRPHNGPPRDWGVAQGRDGFFYACRRW